MLPSTLSEIAITVPHFLFIYPKREVVDPSPKLQLIENHIPRFKINVEHS
jgi:hypothetical protein